jgi:hypothetical protein
VAGWVHVEFFGPQGVKDLADLAPAGFARQLLTSNKEPVGEALTMPPGSRLVIPIDGLGYVRIRGRVALDDRSTTDDIEGAVRFFIFGAEPDRERLVRVVGDAAGARAAALQERRRGGAAALFATFRTKTELAGGAHRKEVFCGRKLAPAALEDLLWSLLLHPEFQYLY